ncbi:branched-chain amino acid ABC transporter permease [Qiania dongpingensis]|uniref:Branched-chain amino acid ABC transporter permease n=1 Tax=Qiania dongpingensis TaxID=2763669 RepID=A0A7G9G5B5_9FIRM|nr:branched-chain amino acid ABC transporter permease [Qiania dongpingensis]QNM05997.1 branched-chain amino acid ABC transporter permease [Qiania dongpingensis]
MIAQQLINGLTLGVLYALLALGYTLIFGTLSFINFAHGEVSLLGAYLAWFAIARMGLGVIPACIFGVVITSVVGVVMERVGYKPIRTAPKLAMITVSVGFSYIVQTAIQLIFGTQPHEFKVMNVTSWSFAGITINSIHILVLIVSIILMVSLQLFIHYTKSGRSIRAISMDQDTAGLMGINVNATISLTFAIGSALGAVSSILMGMYYAQVYPMMGTSIGNKAFAAAVLGGSGSIPGAMLGGIMMGLIESIAGTVLNTQVREGVAFVVMILILIFKPSGILGKEVVKD